MATPELERIGEAIKFTWPSYHLTVILDRFREHRGGVTAEFLAATTAPGYAPHLTQAQLNLAAMRTRTEFVRRLSALYKEANWDEVLETVCALGLRLHREGEPILRLTDDAQIEPPTARLHPFVYDGLPTIIFGPGGIGKSVFALFLALLVEHGGWEGPLCGTPGGALYLDFESDYADLVDRAKRLRRGHPGLGDAMPLYRRCHIPLADDVPALQRYIAENSIKLLIVDSLAAACGAELEKAETAVRFFNALRSLRVGSLILAHVPKNSDEPSIYGSVFFSNFARSTWEMRRVQEVGDSITRVGLYHRKSNLSALHSPLGFKIQFGEAIVLEPMELTDEPGLAAGLPLRTRIKRALEGGGKTARSLAEELGIPVQRLKPRLTEGLGRWYTKVGNEGREAVWGLLDRHQAEDGRDIVTS